MTPEDILAKLGGVEEVRAYLRGLEPGSEADKDAQRAMLAAISAMDAAGVYPIMAEVKPKLYGQACLLLCRMWTDAEDSAAAAIGMQYAGIILMLRYNEKNKKDATENG